MHDYIPERDDYLNWKDDWNKIPEWDDGTNTETDSKNNLYWYVDHQLHRNDDKPAVIKKDIVIQWWKNGQHYRENDKPCSIKPNGWRLWKNESQILHRDYDRPADIAPNGTKRWFFGGQEYWPIKSIQKSILFNHNLISFYVLDKFFIPKLFTPEFQKQLFDKNPSLVTKIPKELLIPEYEGLGILGDLGL